MPLASRGEKISILGEGPEAEAIGTLLTDLLDLIRQGHRPTSQDMDYAIREAKAGTTNSLAELYETAIPVSRGRPPVKARTHNQRRYVEAIRKDDLVFGIGPAGTGKTYLAMAMALSMLIQKEIEQIVLTRPAVEAGESLGFLPGDMEQKVSPYLRPLYDALYDMMEREEVLRHMDRGVIEIAPLAFMRGRTFRRSFVILDEAQNTTHQQMKMFLTRLGPDAQAVITGDVTQIDLGGGKKSGLFEAANILKHTKGIELICFDKSDVVRHKLVRDIIQAYEVMEARQKKTEGPEDNPNELQAIS